jgi:hypothetical protein
MMMRVRGVACDLFRFLFCKKRLFSPGKVLTRRHFLRCVETRKRRHAKEKETILVSEYERDDDVALVSRVHLEMCVRERIDRKDNNGVVVG